MRIAIDIEANALRNPTKVWVIACKDLDTGQIYVFKEVSYTEDELKRFLEFAKNVTLWVGHNLLEYDLPVLYRLIGLPEVPLENIKDTLIISRMVDYSRKGGHSIAQYGEEFGFPKLTAPSFSVYSEPLVEYCSRDAEICERIYRRYDRLIADPSWHQSVALEHRFQLVVNGLHDSGFSFDVASAERLLERVTAELKELDDGIAEAFPPRETLIREFTPKLTKYGTISKSSVPRSLHPRIHEYEAGVVYRHTKQQPFNPSSHKQLIQILNEAGWRPEHKTKTHIECEREINRLKYRKGRDSSVDTTLQVLHNKYDGLKKVGWQVNEHNLSTLPDSAPAPARLLAKRILLEARRRSLVEWLGLVWEDGRIHGKFMGIGAWTHRMAHQNPNTANIPGEYKLDGSVKLLGKEFRQLWRADKRKLLVGVDAEGIQLRIFAHYIDDPEFTDALVKGKKDDKTDPHSLNARILGDACKSRAAAKRFIYALLLGAGITKLAQILECDEQEAKRSLDRLLVRYTGFARLKEEVIPKDAKRGYFVGLDGRKILIPGDTEGSRRHLCMSGYLQSGEAIAVKRAAIITDDTLKDLKVDGRWKFVNIVHDELQSEVRNDMFLALKVAKIKADAIRQAGEELKLKCPLAGSYWNEDHKKYTIGANWYATH